MDKDQYELHRQIEMDHWWFQARRFIIRELARKLVPPQVGEVALDIGCGTGGNAIYLAEDYEVYGIDSSLEAISFANSYESNASFLHVDPDNMAQDHVQDLFKSAKIIFLMDVLEHIEFEASMLADLIGYAAPGAYFIITVPADMNLWSVHDVAFGHFRRYDIEGFQKLWKDQSVDPLMTSYFNNRLQPIIKAIRIISRRTKSTRGESGTDIKKSSPLINHILRGVFAGESRRLCHLLSGKRNTGYSKGVSLIAVLQKNTAPLVAC
jgi:trans-aconitate methyltransferase